MNGKLENEKTEGDNKAVDCSSEIVATMMRAPGVNRRDTMIEWHFRQHVLKSDWTETPDSDTQPLFRNAVRWVERKNQNIFYTYPLRALANIQHETGISWISSRRSTPKTGVAKAFLERHSRACVGAQVITPLLFWEDHPFELGLHHMSFYKYNKNNL